MDPHFVAANYGFNSKGVGIGFVAISTVVAWASLTKNKVIDLGSLNYTLHPYLIGLISHITMIIFGFTGSLLFPDKTAEEKYIRPILSKRNIEKKD